MTKGIHLDAFAISAPKERQKRLSILHVILKYEILNKMSKFTV